nr:MAG TPA: hypothetical protein [Caudoviricetes sp.]
MEQNYWGKDPGKKISGIGSALICLSALAIIAGIIFLCAAQKPSSRSYLSSKYDEYLEEYSAYESNLQTGWTMIGGGISLLLVGLGVTYAGDCVEYRNDLIREQNELLKKQEARVIKKEFEEYEAAKAEAKAKAKAARAEAEAEEKKAE